MRFEGQLAVVTGANSAIGRASAIRLLEEGAMVVVADLEHSDPLPPLAVERVDTVVAKRADPATPGAVVAATGRHDGPSGILVNAAGARPGRANPLRQVAPPEWVAAAICHLASQESRYTGACLDVDGRYAMDGSLPGATYP
jgi:NAD(P)-dependent dehydrogenase (short-subunit alcohol dehydrogenase family)